jgi:hypothetical protein
MQKIIRKRARVIEARLLTEDRPFAYPSSFRSAGRTAGNASAWGSDCVGLGMALTCTFNVPITQQANACRNGDVPHGRTRRPPSKAAQVRGRYSCPRRSASFYRQSSCHQSVRASTTAGEALNEAAAMEKAAKAAAEFKVPANRLMAPFRGVALMPLAPDTL